MPTYTSESTKSSCFERQLNFPQITNAMTCMARLPTPTLGNLKVRLIMHDGSEDGGCRSAKMDPLNRVISMSSWLKKQRTPSPLNPPHPFHRGGKWAATARCLPPARRFRRPVGNCVAGLGRRQTWAERPTMWMWTCGVRKGPGKSNARGDTDAHHLAPQRGAHWWGTLAWLGRMTFRGEVPGGLQEGGRSRSLHR